jgi:hypothetical protein
VSAEIASISRQVSIDGLRHAAMVAKRRTSPLIRRSTLEVGRLGRATCLVATGFASPAPI